MMLYGSCAFYSSKLILFAGDCAISSTKEDLTIESYKASFLAFCLIDARKLLDSFGLVSAF